VLQLLDAGGESSFLLRQVELACIELACTRLQALLVRCGLRRNVGLTLAEHLLPRLEGDSRLGQLSLAVGELRFTLCDLLLELAGFLVLRLRLLLALGQALHQLLAARFRIPSLRRDLRFRPRQGFLAPGDLLE